MKINLEEVVRALSVALDLTQISLSENKIVESNSNVNTNFYNHTFIHHSKRTTYIALEISKTLSLDTSSTVELYVSSLLHDIGSLNSLLKSDDTNNFVKQHCLIGASIVDAFPIFDDLCNIILHHHENVDGSGPNGLKCSEIPIESQIIRISDLVESYHNPVLPSYLQKHSIVNWVISQEDKIFSKEIVNAFLKVSSIDMFWFNMDNIQYMDFILDNISPKLDIYMDINQFESIAYIFSKVIDNKSKFTAMHSRGISNLAFNVSKYLNYPHEKCIKMKIAGLLHDIGKLAIPSDILDKNGALTSDEFAIIKSHSYYTNMILSRIKNIDDIKNWASNHHEKLNSKGYPRGLNSSELCEESRILSVCDIYQALTEDRPYRKGLDNEKAFSIIDNMASEGEICPTAVCYLKDTLKLYYNIR